MYRIYCFVKIEPGDTSSFTLPFIPSHQGRGDEPSPLAGGQGKGDFPKNNPDKALESILSDFLEMANLEDTSL
jgi:hypothetical protein